MSLFLPSLKRKPPPKPSTHQRGQRSEERALALALSTNLPWVLGARRCTPLEDHQGIDLVIHTDAGDINVQVKSSRRAAEKFAQRGLPPIILVVGDLPDHVVQASLKESLTHHRLNSP